MIVLYVFFFTWSTCDTWGTLGVPQGQLDAPNIILGHYGLVGDYVCSSGDALADPGGPRRRLLDINARSSEGRAKVDLENRSFSR